MDEQSRNAHNIAKRWRSCNTCNKGKIPMAASFTTSLCKECFLDKYSRTASRETCIHAYDLKGKEHRPSTQSTYIAILRQFDPCNFTEDMDPETAKLLILDSPYVKAKRHEPKAAAARIQKARTLVTLWHRRNGTKSPLDSDHTGWSPIRGLTRALRNSPGPAPVNRKAIHKSLALRYLTGASNFGSSDWIRIRNELFVSMLVNQGRRAADITHITWPATWDRRRKFVHATHQKAVPGASTLTAIPLVNDDIGWRLGRPQNIIVKELRSAILSAWQLPDAPSFLTCNARIGHTSEPSSTPASENSVTSVINHVRDKESLPNTSAKPLGRNFALSRAARDERLQAHLKFSGHSELHSAKYYVLDMSSSSTE
jgi:hypothetical protein